MGGLRAVLGEGLWERQGWGWGEAPRSALSRVRELPRAGRRGACGGGQSARHLLGLRGGASGRRSKRGSASAKCPVSQEKGFPGF